MLNALICFGTSECAQAIFVLCWKFIFMGTVMIVLRIGCAKVKQNEKK